ncbi:MAG: TetR/AcrR family transcriptional regulator [Myxococcales bacterium]|nr:TetR/AcrR family transcriptional regulator [Myxococcales bacterium]
MPQRLKESVRARILAAAGEVFADQGFPAARLTDIAARAGTSASNLYKYFPGKAALFDAVVTPALVDTFQRRLGARLDELAGRPDWTGADARGSATARDLLTFWVEHRPVAVLLMRGAEGTPYADRRPAMIADMVERAVRHREATVGPVPPTLRFVLETVFTRTLDTLADVLRAHPDPDHLRDAVGHFWRYQLAGLQALMGSP